MDKVILHQFLKSGYVETGTLFPTEMGTPQGGTISTTICNMVLDGLEPVLKEHFKPKWVDGKIFYSAVNYARYADDFIITGKDPVILENEVKPIVRQFLEERGLTLSEEKTLIDKLKVAIGNNIVDGLTMHPKHSCHFRETVSGCHNVCIQFLILYRAVIVLGSIPSFKRPQKILCKRRDMTV